MHEALYFIKKMSTLGMRAEHVESDGIKRMCEWEKTPDSAKKCRSLEATHWGELVSVIPQLHSTVLFSLSACSQAPFTSVLDRVMAR